ncbi:MAG: leucyl aminopeptidase [Propionibacteriaceae bacterium]|jgi:leucyl aminopeptidase|nr:leucyl aminopeptidase [Propionibacteriaceae bacterium]
MELTLKRTLPKDADAVVVGLARCDGRTRLTGWPPDRDKAFAKRAGQSLLSAAEVVGATPKRGEVRQLPDGRQRVVVVGLGEGALEPGPVRQAVATAVRAAGGTEDHPVRHVAVSLGLDGPEFVKAIAEGALLGAYRYQPISAKTPPVGLERLTLIGPADAAAKRACDLARATARAVVRARDLVNRPPNLLAPADLAAKAEEWALAAGAKCEVLDERALEEQGFGGLVAVGSGSARPPRLVKVTWAPRGAQTHVALVGKGITFDSGGLDIKPAPSMVTMGGDMSGAADCLAAAVAAAELKLKVRVTAWLCCAENMPSGTAYRPSDVLTIRGGTTVENYNTDAEGRLVLADGLARAAEDGPDLIVDVATLTGAKMIALGQTTNAVFASDDTVADQLIDAAEAAGESFWHLPITDEAEESLRSKVADVKSGGKREGGALVAAAFLRRFTAGAPWAHLDIAGSNFNEGEPKGVLASGATGVGVPTLVALLTSLAA